jgi:hypothetical protein
MVARFDDDRIRQFQHSVSHYEMAAPLSVECQKTPLENLLQKRKIFYKIETFVYLGIAHEGHLSEMELRLPSWLKPGNQFSWISVLVVFEARSRVLLFSISDFIKKDHSITLFVYAKLEPGSFQLKKVLYLPLFSLSKYTGSPNHSYLQCFLSVVSLPFILAKLVSIDVQKI